MAVPYFQPIIGSSFDSIGNQELAWQGFNQRQTEDNLRRAQEADMAGNRWFENLAQMQQRDQERESQAQTLANQTAAQAQVENRRLALSAQNEAERVREFGVDTALKEKQLDYPERLQKIQDQKQEDYLNDLGESMDPHVNQAGREFEQAQKAVREADARKQGVIAQELKNLPPGTMYNKGQFVKTLLGKPTSWADKTESDAAIQAAANVADAQAEYDNAVRDARDTASTWSQIHADLSKQGLPPVKIGDEWHIRSPRLKKTFGQSAKASKAAAPPVTSMPDEEAGARAMDVLNSIGNGSEPSASVWSGFNPQGTASTPAATSIRQVPPGTPGANVVFNPATNAATPVSASTPQAAGPMQPPAQAPASPLVAIPDEQIKSVPPTNPVWTPQGFADQSGRVEGAANPDWSQPLQYKSPQDVMQLYYGGRISKTQALKAIAANFPGLPPNQTVQLSLGPEWQKPPNPNHVRWAPNTPGQYAGFVSGVAPSPYE